MGILVEYSSFDADIKEIKIPLGSHSIYQSIKPVINLDIEDEVDTKFIYRVVDESVPHVISATLSVEELQEQIKVLQKLLKQALSTSTTPAIHSIWNQRKEVIR